MNEYFCHIEKATDPLGFDPREKIAKLLAVDFGTVLRMDGCFMAGSQQGKTKTKRRSELRGSHSEENQRGTLHGFLRLFGE